MTKFYVGLSACAAMFAIAAVINQAGIRQAVGKDKAAQDNATSDAAQSDTQGTVESKRTRTDRELRSDREVQTSTGRRERLDPGYRASALIGMNVRGHDRDKNIGEIKDVMLNRDGKVKYLAVSFGGFLGVGDKMFAVPWEALEIAKTDRSTFARIDVTEDQLKQRQGFDKDNWPARADQSFMHQRAERQVERTTTTERTR